MITVANHRGKRSFTIPNAWEELSPAEYLGVIALLGQLTAGQLNLFDFKFALLRLLTGFTPKRKKRYGAADVDTIYGNLALLAEQLTFPLKEVDGALQPNLNFRRNPLPRLKIGRKTFTGCTFNLGLTVSSTITAKQYCDAHDVLIAYSKSRHAPLLAVLCAILYGEYRAYGPAEVDEQVKKYFSRLPLLAQQGVYHWFVGVNAWLVRTPPYSLLFGGSDKQTDEQRATLGFDENIMQLSESGYGSKVDLNRIPVTEFFDLMVKDMKRWVRKALSDGAKRETLIRDLGIDRFNALTT